MSFQVAAKTALQEVVRVTFRKVSNTFMKIGTHVQLINDSVLKAIKCYQVQDMAPVSEYLYLPGITYYSL